jgi:hypothetical protein
MESNPVQTIEISQLIDQKKSSLSAPASEAAQPCSFAPPRNETR